MIYHEIDFPTVSAAKHRTVLALSGGNPVEGPPNKPPGMFHHPNDAPEADKFPWGFDTSKGKDEPSSYVFHPLDLRQLPLLTSLGDFRGMRSDIPTLIISECMLCYLEVDTAEQIVKWFMDRILSIGIVIYEPIGPDDPFGERMVQNLRARGIVMPTMQKYKNLEDQIQRLKALGFKGLEGDAGARAETIKNIWDTWISDDERERVDSLEGLDEVEEWVLLAKHYAVVWGWRAEIGFARWKVPHTPRVLSAKLV